MTTPSASSGLRKRQPSAEPITQIVSPLLAGLSSDLVIHSHLSSGTAAVECALHGIPTLLIDREGAHKSKFHELLPVEKIIFKDFKVYSIYIHSTC